MGFEVVYYYHERLPNGKWNMDERQEMKKKIGNPIDEVELEKLAAIILAQLAKRDKLVVDVDVYEYSKRKINYKEATDGTGIILKNKKFNTAALAGELVEEEAVGEIEHDGNPHVNLAPLPVAANRNLAPLPRNEDASRASNKGRIKGWMLYDPEIHNLHEAKSKGLRFTEGKKYPVYDKVEHPGGLSMGHLITVVDDAGRQQTLSDKYFVESTQIRLVGDDEVGFTQPQRRNDPRLSYGGDYDDKMPDLRPGARRM